MKKKALCILLVLIIGLAQIMPAYAATISELKQQLAETQNQLNAINGQAAGLEGKKDAVEEEIDELDGTLVELMSSIALLEEEIENKKEEIVQVQEELEDAIKREETQYEAMKKRIKFMYEKGNSTYAQLLFESKSISDMMNKADYIEKLYAYDRKLLLQYQETRQEVADLKEALEEEKSGGFPLVPIVIAIGLIAVIAAVVIILKERKKRLRKSQEEEFLYELDGSSEDEQ